jgi:putative ABC transport system permease protein
MLAKAGKYEAYDSAYKTDESREIGFMSISHYNALGLHKEIHINANEYYVVAGNEGLIPNTKAI